MTTTYTLLYSGRPMLTAVVTDRIDAKLRNNRLLALATTVVGSDGTRERGSEWVDRRGVEAVTTTVGKRA